MDQDTEELKLLNNLRELLTAWLDGLSDPVAKRDDIRRIRQSIQRVLITMDKLDVWP